LNCEFDIFTAVVALAWCCTLPLDSLLSIAIASFVFFSRYIPISILFLLSLNLLAHIQATLGGKKSLSGKTQKRYFVVFFGNLCALIGSTLPDSPVSYPLIFFGILLTMSNAFSSAFFYEHLESLSLKSYLQSVIIPSLVAIDILLKVKAGVKADYGQLWDITLMALGISTLLISSLLALSKRRVKALLIYFSHSWLGLLLFLLVIDAGSLSSSAFASIAIASVGSAMLLDVSSKLGGRYFSFAKIVALGFPGTAVFAAIYFAFKLTITLNIAWLALLGVCYLISATALIGARPGPVESGARVQFRFWFITFTQFATGIFVLSMDKGFLK
jgi:hypothetical protein